MLQEDHSMYYNGETVCKASSVGPEYMSCRKLSLQASQVICCRGGYREEATTNALTPASRNEGEQLSFSTVSTHIAS